MNDNSLCIVLKTSNYKEADSMLTLFSREKGRIEALARGCRKTGSSLLSCTDIFCCADFGFNVSKDKYYVTQAVLKENFYSIRKNMKALMTATVFNEICDHVVMPGESNPRLFALHAGALFALSKGEESGKVFFYYLIKLLDILGLRPVTECCAACGSKEAHRFSLLAGGMVCDRCGGEEVPDSFKVMIEKCLNTPPKRISELELQVSASILQLSIEWLKNAIEFEPNSLKLLKTVWNLY